MLHMLDKDEGGGDGDERVATATAPHHISLYSNTFFYYRTPLGTAPHRTATVRPTEEASRRVAAPLPFKLLR